MKRITAVLLALPLIGLTGCDSDTQAGGPTDPPEREVVTETVTVTADPEVVTETVTVTAESQAAPEPTEDASEGEDAQGTSEREDADFGDSETSRRGNLIKSVGQPGGIVNADGAVTVTFTLTEIESNFACTSDMADPPQNGQYLALSFDVETTELLEPGETFAMTDWDFTLFGEDGTRENDSTGNAMWCIDAGASLPSSIGPAQKASGKVILDTGLESGVIVYSPMWSFDDLGWEWEF